MRRLFPVLLLCGCAGPEASTPATITAVPAAAAVACGDMAAFRARALEGADHADRATIARWQPPAAVPASDRPVIEKLAHLYIMSCGLGETVALTQQLVAFPTISAKESPKDGPSFVAMAGFLRQWSAARGLQFNVFGENDAWEIVLGKGDKHVAFVMHADVVPVADAEAGALPPGWTSPAFEARVVGDRLYGRGAEDNKGSIAAGMVVLDTMVRMGLQPAGQVVVAMGTAEESDWDGMIRYAREQPQAQFVISTDASFPLVIAESGFVSWRLAIDAGESSGPIRVTAVSGGEFLTQVPGEASLTLSTTGDPSELEALVRMAVKAERHNREGYTFEVEVDQSADTVTVNVTGEAVHSSVAEQGRNALWALSALAASLPLPEGGVRSTLRLIADRFDGDHYGEKLGLSYEHDMMGRLLVAPTILRLDGGQVTLAVNMRRPAGKTSAEFTTELAGALSRIKSEVDGGFAQQREAYVGEAHIADLDGPLVPTLMEIYGKHTGDRDSKPISIRGGTYARLFKGAVDFGPSFPGKPYRGHAPDEYIELEALQQTTQMMMEAALKLDALAASESARPLSLK